MAQYLDKTEKISAGGEYTFRFSSDGFFKLSSDDIAAKLTGSKLPISAVNCRYEGGFGGLFGSILVVSFKWNQTGWIVQQVQENIAAVAAHFTAANLTFLSAKGGTEIDSTGDISKPSTSTVFWVVIVLVALVFAGAFGSSYAKRV